MEFYFRFPGVARINCQDCLKRLYNFETGAPMTYEAGPNRELKYYDLPGQGGPCRTGKYIHGLPEGRCPKGSPETAYLHELSELNWGVIDFWRRVKATNGAYLNDAERDDELLMDRLAIIDQRMTDEDQRQLATRVAHSVMLATRAR